MSPIAITESDMLIDVILAFELNVRLEILTTGMDCPPIDTVAGILTLVIVDEENEIFALAESTF
ncbi:MAG: hypothetical protein EBS18_04860 [Actinobacteria bacterium]|nr:hypothetical protein [Actinomycetota bacterium]